MDQLSTIILAASLFIIMLGMGLSLVADDFKRVLFYPKAVLVGLVNQLVLLPLIGFGIASVFNLRPEIAVGIIILVACPGGPTSNLITHLAKGNTALSVTLTTLNSFITILTIPFIVNIGLEQFLDEGQLVRLDVVKTILQVMVIIIIPIVIGMTIRKYAVNFAMKMAKPVRIASGAVLTLVIIGIMVAKKEVLGDSIREAGSASLALNVITMFVGYRTAKWLKLNDKSAICISIESGIQSATLAISIAVVLLDNQDFAIAPAVYGLLMFFPAGVMIYWANRKLAKQ